MPACQALADPGIMNCMVASVSSSSTALLAAHRGQLAADPAAAAAAAGPAAGGDGGSSSSAIRSFRSAIRERKQTHSSRGGHMSCKSSLSCIWPPPSTLSAATPSASGARYTGQLLHHATNHADWGPLYVSFPFPPPLSLLVQVLSTVLAVTPTLTDCPLSPSLPLSLLGPPSRSISSYACFASPPPFFQLCNPPFPFLFLLRCSPPPHFPTARKTEKGHKQGERTRATLLRIGKREASQREKVFFILGGNAQAPPRRPLGANQKRSLQLWWPKEILCRKFFFSFSSARATPN